MPIAGEVECLLYRRLMPDTLRVPLILITVKRKSGKIAVRYFALYP